MDKFNSAEWQSGPVDVPGALAAFWINVGKPLSKSNHRQGTSGRDWSEHAAWSQIVGLRLLQARPSTWDCGSKSAKIDKRPVVVSAIVARSNIDAGNLDKSLLDAGEPCLYFNDKSVRHPLALSVPTNGKPHVAIAAFACLPPGAEPAALIKAGQALISELVAPSTQLQ